LTLIDIQPPSDVYDTFGRLNYKPWYAIAEFVDNATQDAFAHEAELRRDGGPLVHVRVTHRKDTIIVEDDAHGMELAEISRAVRLNAPPPDTSGRSEFGMGLKTAACWFGRLWTVKSTQLGSDKEYSVTFDLERFVNEKVTEIEIHEGPAHVEDHGTRLEIKQLRNTIMGRQVEVLKKSLTSMYRADLRSGRAVIELNGERLQYAEPAFFSETLPSGEQTWRKNFAVEVVDPSTDITHDVSGWIGIRDPMSRKEAGFALLRRGRLIIGGYDAGWRPHELFGQVGNFPWARLVGELNCDSFPVNFSKDGFAWDGGLEDALIEALVPATRDYKDKAGNIRKGRQNVIDGSDVKKSLEEAESRLTRSTLARDLARLEVATPNAVDRTLDVDVHDEMVETSDDPVELKVPMPGGASLTARLFVNKDGRASDEWMVPSFIKDDVVDVFLNRSHPFIVAASENETSFGLVVHFALATALAEKRARYVGGEQVRPDDLRLHLDTFLRHTSAG
jgi:hypothetical protein